MQYKAVYQKVSNEIVLQKMMTTVTVKLLLIVCLVEKKLLQSVQSI